MGGRYRGNGDLGWGGRMDGWTDGRMDRQPPGEHAVLRDRRTVPLYLLGQTDNDAYIPAKIRSTFHDRLRTLCTEQGITYYKLAKDCHFDKSCISKWYALDQIPSFEILELIADRFDVSFDYLLGRTDYKK